MLRKTACLSPSKKLPKPPKCARRPGPTLQCHDISLDRPFEWLKDLKGDPTVKKYLRSEVSYTNSLFKQHSVLKSLRNSLQDELEDRELGGDSQIPQVKNGYYYYETTTIPAVPLSKKVNKGIRDKHVVASLHHKEQKRLSARSSNAASSRTVSPTLSASAHHHHHQPTPPPTTANLSRTTSGKSWNTCRTNDDDDEPTARFPQQSSSSRSPSTARKNSSFASPPHYPSASAAAATEKEDLWYRRGDSSSSSSSSSSSCDDDDDEEHLVCYRVPITDKNSNLIEQFSQKFEKNHSSEIKHHPRHAQVYLDLNLVAQRLNKSKYAEEEDLDISPDNNSVVCAFDTTPGGEQYTVAAIDCETQKQLCVIGVAAQGLLSGKIKDPDSCNNNNKTTQFSENNNNSSKSTKKNNKKKHHHHHLVNKPPPVIHDHVGKSKKPSSFHGEVPADYETTMKRVGGGTTSAYSAFFPQKIIKIEQYSPLQGFVIEEIERCGEMCIWLNNHTFAFVELEEETLRSYRVWAVTLPNNNNICNSAFNGTSATSSSSSSSPPIHSFEKNSKPCCYLYLLYEEQDPCFEVCGLIPTQDKNFVIINSSTSSCSSQYIIDLNKFSSEIPSCATTSIYKNPASTGEKQQKDSKSSAASIAAAVAVVPSAAPTSSFSFYSATAFYPRTPGRTLEVNHDPRPIDFFVNLNKNGSTDGAKSGSPKSNNNTDDEHEKGGTWFISHNLEGHGTVFKVDIVSTTTAAGCAVVNKSPRRGSKNNNNNNNNNNTLPFLFTNRNSWITFFAPNIPAECHHHYLLSPNTAAVLASGTSNDSKNKNKEKFKASNTNDDDDDEDQILSVSSTSSAIATPGREITTIKTITTTTTKTTTTVISLKDCVFIEDVNCFKNFLIFTVRKNGFQNVLMFDYLQHQLQKKKKNNNNDNNKNNTNDNKMMSKDSNSILTLDDLIDIKKIIFPSSASSGENSEQQQQNRNRSNSPNSKKKKQQQSTNNSKRKNNLEDKNRQQFYTDETTTWLELNIDCDYETENIRVYAYNIVVPDREYMLERSNKSNNNDNNHNSKTNNKSNNNVKSAPVVVVDGWTSKLLLIDKQNSYNPNKYEIQLHQVPVPLNPFLNENGKNLNNHNVLVEVPLLLAFRKDKYYLNVLEAKRKAATSPNSSRVKPPPLNPLVLSAYASYGSAYDPEFNAGRVSLLNRGVVIGVCMARGGGEYGDVWRRAGSKENRPCTFSDFIHCAEYCGDQTKNKNSIFIDPKRICCYGESAGGTIIGNVINQRPELFSGAVARVPFVCCLDSLMNEHLPLTRQEWEDWGNPLESKETFELIRSYSPIDNMAPLLLPDTTTSSSKPSKSKTSTAAATAASSTSSSKKKTSSTTTPTAKHHQNDSENDNNGEKDDDEEDENNNKTEQEEVIYPNLYVESGLNDPRVLFHEAAIWVAMLRERWRALGSQTAGRLLVHQVNFEGGHDGAADVDDDKQEAQEMAFILNSLGIQK